MRIRLPKGTPAQYREISCHSDDHVRFSDAFTSPALLQGLRFDVKDGQYVPQWSGLYPRFFVRFDTFKDTPEFKAALSAASPDFQEFFSQIHPYSIPVIINGDDLETDLYWIPLGILCGDCLGKESALVFDALEKGILDWKISCPVYGAKHCSYMGQLMYFHSTPHNIPNQYGDSEPVFLLTQRFMYVLKFEILPHFPLIEMLKNIPNSELFEFLDNGHNLLDMACDYHLWEVADWLWGKGLRWTDGYVKNGIVLEKLIWGNYILSGESNPIVPLKGEILPTVFKRDHSWLKLWLDRYHHDGRHPKTLSVIVDGDFSYLDDNNNARIQEELAEEKIYKAPIFHFWLLHAAYDLDKDVHTPEIQEWVRFWNKNGIDFRTAFFRNSAKNPQHINLEAYLQTLDQTLVIPDFLKIVLSAQSAQDANMLQQQTPLIIGSPKPIERL